MHPVLLTLLVLIVIGSVLYCYLVALRQTDSSTDVKSTKGFMDKLNIFLCDFAVHLAFSHIDRVLGMDGSVATQSYLFGKRSG